MDFEEHAAKPLLVAAGIAVPESGLAQNAEEAASVAGRIGSCAIKAQVPTGRRGKAGGIKFANSPEEAKAAAEAILGMEIGIHSVEKVLVEARVDIAAEYYAAVLNDQASRGPLIVMSTEGGVDIEEIAAAHPDRIARIPVDIRKGATEAAIEAGLAPLALGDRVGAVAGVLRKLYRVYADNDGELVEVNPLAVTGGGDLIALDCKFILDDSGAARRPDLREKAAPEKLKALEIRAREHGLKYIDLDGPVGILANGAGLTMTTMDMVRYYGGAPANFLEIGGEAYTLGKPALELMMSNPRIKSLLINFCGAFGRTDVMTEGVVQAWEELRPDLPAFFSIHGTNEDEAVAILRGRLGMEPYDLMDDAVRAAVEAAR